MAYVDLRQWLDDVEKDGDLVRHSGASHDLEMSAIAEMMAHSSKGPMPALLFHDIPGFAADFQTLFGILASPRRVARALYLPLSPQETRSVALVRNWRAKARDMKLVPPRLVKAGPVQENVDAGDKVDLTRFPAPRCHELDGGRYIGTACAVILKDPDSDWVNLGTYRCMLVDQNRIALHILEDRHGRTIAHDRYLARGRVMPVAVAIGLDPTLWFCATQHSVPWGVSEYDYAGGIRGEPIEVIKGPYTGLPVPARAEIVIEGECQPGELVDEGPFGEWHGYFGNLGLETVPEPVIRVKSVLYRSSPILTCGVPSIPPSDHTFVGCVARSIQIWERLEKAGIPGIAGVWCHEEGGGPLFNVIAIKQMYAGHSTETGLIASQKVPTGGRYTIVVDDDIDAANLSQVIWAMSTRSDPQRSIQILRRCASTTADTTIPPEEKRKWKVAPKPLFNSRAVVDACQPFEWKQEWYPVARVSPALEKQIIDKWPRLFA